MTKNKNKKKKKALKKVAQEYNLVKREKSQISNVHNSILKKRNPAYAPYPKVDEIRRGQFHNAACYVASVIDPFNHPGCRIPDLTMRPTGVHSDITDITCAMVNGSTSDRFAAVAVGPFVTKSFLCVSSGVSKNSFTWGTPATKETQVFMDTNFDSVRTVSMAIRVADYGKLLDRGVRFLVGYFTGSQYTLPANMTDFESMMETTAVNIVDGDYWEFTWEPTFGGPFYHSSNQAYANATGWYTPVSDQSGNSDQRWLVVMAYSSDTTVSDNITMRVITNYETIPFSAVAENFKREVVLGGQQEIATAMSMRSKREAPNIQSNVTKVREYKPKSKGYVDRMIDIVNRSGHSALQAGLQQFAGNVIAEGMEMVPMLLAKHHQWLALKSFGLKISYHDKVVQTLLEMDPLTRLEKIKKMINMKYHSEHDVDQETGRPTETRLVHLLDDEKFDSDSRYSFLQ